MCRLKEGEVTSDWPEWLWGEVKGHPGVEGEAYQHLVQYLPCSLYVCVCVCDWSAQPGGHSYRSERPVIIVCMSLCVCEYICVCLGRGRGTRGDSSPVATVWTVDPSASSKYLQSVGQSEPSRHWPPATTWRSVSSMCLCLCVFMCASAVTPHNFPFKLNSLRCGRAAQGVLTLT